MIRLSVLYGMPVRRLQQELDAADIAELLKYDELFGLPDLCATTRAIQAALYNTQGIKKKDGSQVTAEDFDKSPRPPMTAQQIREGLEQMGRRHGKR